MHKATVISKAFTADAAFGYDKDRQYLMILVESGAASLSLGGGDSFVLDKYYEPYKIPIGAFAITGVTGRVVVITNQSTLDTQV